jgi:YD repeat-containing protein
MKFFPLGLAISCAPLLCGNTIGLGQSPEQGRNDAVRVTVSMHPDGSRTVYNFDAAQHKAVATTTDQEGKLRETIRYELDDAGRFSSAEISGPDGRLRFKSRYKYDDAGHLLEETQSAGDGTLLHKIVYSYDSSGKQTGYSVFDASGKLVGRNGASINRASPSPKPRGKAPR